MSEAGFPGPRPERPLLVVLLGTDRRPFPRLLRWVGSWASEHPVWRVEVQHGTTAAPPFGHAVAYLSGDELRRLLRAAAVLVTDGEPATIGRARAFGHVPVVVAREPGLGEHADDEQLLVARRLGAAGLIWPAESEAGLDRAIRAALTAAAGTDDEVQEPPDGSPGGQGRNDRGPGRGGDHGPRAPGRRAVWRRRRR